MRQPITFTITASRACKRHRREAIPLTEAVKAKDPVCGMMVDKAAPRGGQYHYKDVDCFFCSPRCNDRFRATPETYLDPAHRPAGMMHAPLTQLGGIKPAASLPNPPAASASTPAQPAAASSESASTNTTFYICPMCPEVRSPVPGGALRDQRPERIDGKAGNFGGGEINPDQDIARCGGGREFHRRGWREGIPHGGGLDHGDHFAQSLAFSHRRDQYGSNTALVHNSFARI